MTIILDLHPAGRDVALPARARRARPVGRRRPRRRGAASRAALAALEPGVGASGGRLGGPAPRRRARRHRRGGDRVRPAPGRRGGRRAPRASRSSTRSTSTCAWRRRSASASSCSGSSSGAAAPSYPGSSASGAPLLAVLVAQMILGEVQYRNALPWGLVLVHVFLAATIWSLSVVIAYVLWRPPAALGRHAGPLRRAPAAVGHAGPRVRSRDGRQPGAAHRRSTPTLRRPVLIAAFRGWNDGGQAATLAAGTLGARLGAQALRRDRPRGIRRLPVDAPDGDARRGDDAADRMARDHLPRRGDPGRRPRRGDPARRRAELSLARVQRARRRSRARPRGRAGRHARSVARRRAAHTPGARHGCRQRPLARRGARPAAVALRGADGHRRRAARRVPPGGDSLGEPLVGGAALRLARAEPAGGAARSATASASCSG